MSFVPLKPKIYLISHGQVLFRPIEERVTTRRRRRRLRGKRKAGILRPYMSWDYIGDTPGFTLSFAIPRRPA
ncbi:hypothetical protein ASG63_08555 [Methylobacterium sp. Leaf94]|uniref:hypothetical protein n=1 Tax=Methylobacterium sp. Leaf94 TaxID=1736250 RepID=UPI0007132416|nr:hypothetical protein [Methylobacterium sp. Leaf94]KQU17552.1 hypothetical protein ASG63_08555 [Methylobacterium sp. Leaf94]